MKAGLHAGDRTTATPATAESAGSPPRTRARWGPLLGFWTEAPPEARRALVAASLGWMLDSFDVMLYALVLAALIADLGMSTTTAGLLGSLTLVASAAGGLLFGVLADRYGRTRALIWSVLIYSIFTALCGFAQSVAQLAVFRVCLGIGMGGEWATGAALVSETWPAQHRGKALGLVQSAWAIGYGLAAIVTALILPRWGWRAVFFVGILPALLTWWIRRRVPEPEMWRKTRTGAFGPRPAFVDIFRRPIGPLTLMVTLMNACTMYAWWGFNLWIPAYLSLPPDRGGIGLSTGEMAGLIVAMQVGMWFGYVTFGFVSDVIGRKRTYVVYLVCAAALIVAYTSTRDPRVLLVLGPVVAFFGTGYFSGCAAVTAEIYPTSIRASAQGFTYNIGRIASALAPFLVGSLAATRGFGPAFTTAAVAFVLAALCWIGIPETRGRALE
jgi:MFS family permease